MKIAVVTGASRGIGHFLSEKLSKENYKVVNISRKSSNAFIDYSFDLTNTQDIGTLVKQIIKEVGVPDLLINNAGVASMNHTFLMKDSDVEKIVDVNLISPILLSKEFGKFMIKKGGKILNISTVAVPQPTSARPAINETILNLINLNPFLHQTATWACRTICYQDTT